MNPARIANVPHHIIHNGSEERTLVVQQDACHKMGEGEKKDE